MSVNAHVKSFLDYYCELIEPEYAVLLTGPWGSGKTWFVRNYIERHAKTPEQFLYVSLYGVQSTKDIESQLFALLHPVLASKGARVAKTVLKGAVQAVFKIDLNGDGKDDATIKAAVPSDGLLESVSVSRDRVLVVDDLERCSMPTADVLGYMNQFVEHGGVKAIILANEDEVSKLDSKYASIKEKLIGRTLSVEADVDAALVKFVSDMTTDQGRAVVKRHAELLKQTYWASELKNLRLVRHGLVEFERVLQVVDKAARDNSDLMSNFLGLFMARFFEVKSGALPVAEIPNFRDSITHYIKFRERDAEDESKKYFDLRTKYAALNLSDDLVNDEFWEKFFDTGVVDADLLNPSLLHSKYLAAETQANWVKLWHGIDLDDAEFDAVIKDVDKEWDERAYEEIGVVTHVAGLLIRYSRSGLYAKSEEEVLLSAKAYVDELLLRGKVKLPRPNEMRGIFDRQAYGGLGFASLEEDVFKQLLAYIDAKVAAAIEAGRPAEAQELLELLGNDANAFLRRVILNNQPDNYFYKTPILHHLDVDAVVDCLREVRAEAKRTFGYALKGRYEVHQFNAELVVELEWLKRLNERLLVEAERSKGRASSVMFKLLVDVYVREAIEKLEIHAPAKAA